jgi:hypothetical protein
VVVGGIVSYVGAYATERRRWARERSSRWDARRLEAYLEYARALKEESRLTLRIATALGVGTATDPISLEDGRPLRQAAEHERSALFESLLLLGDPLTVSAARAWQQAGWDAYRYLINVSPPTNEGFTPLYEIAGEKRDAFYVSARIGLEIVNGQYVDTERASSLTLAERRF